VHKLLPIVTVSAAIVLSGCQSNSIRLTSVYSQKEFRKMTHCIGLSDTAMHAATSKLKGIPMDQITSYYATKEGFRVNMATVEEVYSENFTSVWDYTISFFEGCAQSLAHVEAENVKQASQCAQNSMIAGLAYTYKSLGTPRVKTYEHFAVFKNKLSNNIVDDVYESRHGRAEVKLDRWSSCMSKLTPN